MPTDSVVVGDTIAPVFEQTVERTCTSRPHYLSAAADSVHQASRVNYSRNVEEANEFSLKVGVQGAGTSWIQKPARV